jgi:hypothetical protein
MKRTKGAAQAQAAERRRQAFELRKAGASYEEIGRLLGVKKQSAHAMVHKTLAGLRAQTEEIAEDVRSLELHRLDALLKGLWPKASQGAPLAVEKALKVMERRAKMTGIDLPDKFAATNPDGSPLDKGHRDGVADAFFLGKTAPG